MLNFRNTNILFIILLMLGIGLDVKYDIPAYVYLILFLIYSLILFYGCYYVGSNFFIPVICSADTNEKVIAISFDDGPDAANTPEILHLLKNNGVKAAFFCIGSRIAENKTLLKQIFDEGHVIGNHSYSHHFWFDMFSSEKMLADMQRTDETMESITGKTPRLFRPPYGVTNPNLKRAIINGNYIPVGWSVRSMDTVIKDKVLLLKKMTGRLKPGAVFLFHDTGKVTLDILSPFIKHARLHGYEIIRLDKMLNLQAYA
jgi:peptidoglycan/xylan/chitin deacetylase (PgdA/CDA1 family)